MDFGWWWGSGAITYLIFNAPFWPDRCSLCVLLCPFLDLKKLTKDLVIWVQCKCVGWNLLLKVNLSKTDPIGPPWTLKHVDEFQCIGSWVQVVGWLGQSVMTRESQDTAQRSTGQFHIATVNEAPLTAYCTMHWVPFTHCSLSPTVDANQGNHPLCVCLLQCSPTIIGKCRIDCWLYIPIIGIFCYHALLWNV